MEVLPTKTCSSISWEACQKKLYGDQSSCVDTRKQTAAQAQATYTLNMNQIESAHQENVAELDDLEKKCFNPLLISGRLSLPADITVGPPGQTAPVPTPTPAPATPPAATSGKYYVVTSTDPAKDTGNEVCASVGKSCVGYTDFSLGQCLIHHPGANQVTDVNGSKAGFYCNGAPQGGVCGKMPNTCMICPQCNVNADCAMEIGVLYRELYVECK